MKSLFSIVLTTLTVFAFHQTLMAQDGENPLLYSTSALRLSAAEFPLSGTNAIIPSVSDPNGFASFIDNPASMALVETSYFSFGFSVLNRRDEISSFGNQATNLNQNPLINNNGLLSDIGFVYKAPTTMGKLSIGAGYTLQKDFHRMNQFDVFNQNSSLTDNLRLGGDGTVAFDVYGTDWNDNTREYVESIFRIGQTSDLEFLGINQLGEINQSGYMGDLSLFGAVEFQENLFVGASIGSTIGRYNYRREFLEEDLNNVYNIDLIDDDEDPATPGTDIELLQFEDRIESELAGFTFRLGTIYKLSEALHLGASATIPTKLRVDETFTESAESVFDNGNGFYSENDGNSVYYINRPAKYSVGVTSFIANDIKISAAADFINYSNATMDARFDDFGGAIERGTNDFISQNFEDVINYRVGLTFNLNNEAKLRASFAHLPSKTSRNTLDRNIFGGGLSLKLNDSIDLDLVTQFSEFDDRSVLYDYENFSGEFVDEVILEKVRRLNFFATLRIAY